MDRLLFLALSLTLFTTPGAGSTASDLTVCIDDRVRLDPHSMRAFVQELRALSTIPIRVDGTTCSAPGAVRIAFRAYPPSRYSNALGLTRVGGPLVLPEVEVYTGNVARTLNGSAGSERFGRAIARVVFHELQHYVRQECGHDERGLFVTALTVRHLTASAVP